MNVNEARNKICHRSMSLLNTYNSEPNNCIAGVCMAWEWMADYDLIDNEGFPYKRARCDKAGDLILSTTEGRCLDLVS